MPLFSIVVPIYNVESYLKTCIDSILHQTFSDFELILVDDGSPDNCPDICDEYKKIDDRVIVIHKQNGGLVSARKAGAERTSGEYVICVDGDDWIDSNYLSRFNEILSVYNNPDVICCGAKWAFINRMVEYPITDKVITYDRILIEKNIFPRLIEDIQGNYFSPSLWGKAFKRELYVPQQLSIDNNVKIGEDNNCTKPILYRADTLILIPECLYFYRQNDESMTKEFKPILWSTPEIISKHLIASIPVEEFDFQNQIYRLIVHYLFNVCVSQFNQEKKYFEIRKDIINNIKAPYYSEAISECKYKKYLKGSIALFCLKHKVTLPMYIYSKIRR